MFNVFSVHLFLVYICFVSVCNFLSARTLFFLSISYFYIKKFFLFPKEKKQQWKRKRWDWEWQCNYNVGLSRAILWELNLHAFKANPTRVIKPLTLRVNVPLRVIPFILCALAISVPSDCPTITIIFPLLGLKSKFIRKVVTFVFFDSITELIKDWTGYKRTCLFSVVMVTNVLCMNHIYA